MEVADLERTVSLDEGRGKDRAGSQEKRDGSELHVDLDLIEYRYIDCGISETWDIELLVRDSPRGHPLTYTSQDVPCMLRALPGPK